MLFDGWNVEILLSIKKIVSYVPLSNNAALLTISAAFYHDFYPLGTRDIYPFELVSKLFAQLLSP